jgi:hypothetical protein
MSDDPQSELQRSRLLNEQKTLIKAQNHLQRVLGGSGGGGGDADDEMSDVEPKEATNRGAVIGEISRLRLVPLLKLQVGPDSRSDCRDQCPTTADRFLDIGKRKRSPETILL